MSSQQKEKKMTENRRDTKTKRENVKTWPLDRTYTVHKGNAPRFIGHRQRAPLGGGPRTFPAKC